MNELSMDRYSRQVLLPNFGINAQKILANSKVLVVGCGGLGSPVIQYLAAAGVGHFSLYDPDLVEISNLNRQVIHRHQDLNRSKAERAAEFIMELNEQIQVQYHADWITIHNARKIIAAHDLVVDCTDGLPNKFLLNDACVLEKCPLIHGSVTMMEGRVLVVKPGSTCLRCLFESLPPEGSIPSCQEVGVLGSICGIIGSIMATEAIKIITGIGAAAIDHYLVATFDNLPTLMNHQIDRNPDCFSCGNKALTNLIESHYVQPPCSIEQST